MSRPAGNFRFPVGINAAAIAHEGFDFFRVPWNVADLMREKLEQAHALAHPQLLKELPHLLTLGHVVRSMRLTRNKGKRRGLVAVENARRNTLSALRAAQFEYTPGRNTDWSVVRGA